MTAAVSAALLVGVSTPAYAVVPVGSCTVSWKSAITTGNWSTATNWDTGFVPGSVGHTAEEVCIPSTATVTLDVAAPTAFIYSVAGINDNGTPPGNIVSPSAAATGALQINGGAGIPASSLGSVNITGGSVSVQAGASLSVTALTVGGLPSGQGNITGTGSLAVNGDLTMAGGAINGALAITQNGTHAFTVGDGPFFHSYIYSPTITTANNINFSGTTLFSAAHVSTSANVVLASGAQLTQTSVLTASGVTNTGTASTIEPGINLTGTTSSIGADLSVGGLGLAPAASLTIPSGRTVTQTAGTTVDSGSVTGLGALVLTGGQLTVDGTGTLSTSSVKIDGSVLTTAVGSTVSIGGLLVANGAWNANGTGASGAHVGAGGLSLSASLPSSATLQGTGSVAVDGDITVAGSQILGAMAVTQTSGHAFVINNGTHVQSYIYNCTITTPNDISESGTTLYSFATVTTTGNLVLNPGAQLTQSSSISAAGVTTSSGTAASVLPTVTLTGTTSNLGADLTVQDLLVANGGRLFLPASRILSVLAPHALTVQAGGSLTGNGTVGGAVVNQGIVSPGTDAAGSTVGTLTVGSLQQVAGGRLAIQESASGNDKVVVSGVTPVSFNGAVAVTTLPGYTPPAGASLTVVSAPGASGAPVLGSSLSTTDDLVSGHFGLPAVSGKDVVVSRVATAPGAPGLSIASTVNGLDVTVSAPSSDGGSPVTGYSVTCTPDCGIHPLSAPGLVSLTGLTAGVTYTVSVTATNVVGTGAAVATSASPASPTPVPTPPAPAPPAAAPTGNVVATPARLVVSTSGVFAAVCSYSGGPVKACSVRATGPTGAVLATGVPVSSATGAATLSERLVVTAAGLKAATAAGGVTVTLTATITPVSGAPVTARSSLVVVKKITKVTFTGGVLFGSNSAVLSAPGKAALVKAAKQIAGSKILECDGHTAKTGNPSGEYKLGLQRATVICTFIKVEVKALKLKAVGKYLVKSYGSTRPASKNAALNRRVELIVTN